MTAGKSYADLRQALADLGLDEGALRRARRAPPAGGAHLPARRRARCARSRGDLDEIVVVEEKRGLPRGAGEGSPRRGSRGASGCSARPTRPARRCSRSRAAWTPTLVAERLGPRLLRLAEGQPDLAARIRRRLDAIRAVRARPHEAHPGRTPNYCSGCPHNVGTRLLPGEVAWGSPGCHSFASIIEQPERHIVSMTQLGGEGLPWIGLAPVHRPAAHGAERRATARCSTRRTSTSGSAWRPAPTSRSRSSTTGSSRTPAPRRWSAGSPCPS